MSGPQNKFETFPNPKYSQFGPQKVKKLPQNQVNIKSQNWRKHRK